MLSIPKTDLLEILKVFARKIGLLFLFVAALYFDGTNFEAKYPNAQVYVNLSLIIGFVFFYRRHVTRTKKLMLYAVVIGFLGEYLFSIILGMYTYRLGNLPWYIPFGHAVVFARVYAFAKTPIIKKYWREITKFFYVVISVFSLFYLVMFNDVFGFVMTLGVFIMLVKRPKDRLFFLTMYIVVAVLEIGGTAYSAWYWPETAFGIFDFLPSNNPPSGISLFYFLLDVGCFVFYITFNQKNWRRFRNIQLVANHRNF